MYCYEGTGSVGNPPRCNYYDYNSPISRIVVSMTETSFMWSFQESEQSAINAEHTPAYYRHITWHNHREKTWDTGTVHEARYTYHGSFNDPGRDFFTGDVIELEVDVQHFNGWGIWAHIVCEVI